MLSNGYKYYTESDGFELNDKVFTGSIHGTYKVHHSPGRMYMPNGDPGYPDEYEEELVKWYLSDIEVTDLECNSVTYSTEEYDAFERYMIDKLDTQDISYE